MNHYKNNLLEELHRLTEAVQASHADIAPTYLEYTQLAFAIARPASPQSVAMANASWVYSR